METLIQLTKDNYNYLHNGKVRFSRLIPQLVLEHQRQGYPEIPAVRIKYGKHPNGKSNLSVCPNLPDSVRQALILHRAQTGETFSHYVNRLLYWHRGFD